MRLREVYLLVVVATVAAVLTFAGSAAATADPACGKTLITSFTLTADIDCTGYGAAALKIGQAGITINLNGHTITGDTNFDVINNGSAYTGLTVENGTLLVTGTGYAIDSINGGDGLTVSNVTITGDGTGSSEGVASEGSSGSPVFGTVVTGSTISGVDLAVDLEYTSGSIVKGNTITTPGSGTYDVGVYNEYGTSDMVMGNTFTSASAQKGYGYLCDHSAGTVISGNTFTALASGIYEHTNPYGYCAGLMITNNTLGAANPAGGNVTGIDLFSDSGDLIQGNFVRNSKSYGVYDYEQNNAVYTGNVLTSNGNNAVLGVTGADNFYIYTSGYGPVTMVNNYSRLAGEYGYYTYEPYNDSADITTPPYSVFSGNAATYNVDTGFYLEDAEAATITDNTAYQNGSPTSTYGSGFYFEQPAQAVIKNNTATLNEQEGFYFTQAYEGYAPLSFADNTATYNGDYGFFSGDNHPVAGSGNNGSNNGSGSCYLVAGCS